jgi:hypothetical protein
MIEKSFAPGPNWKDRFSHLHLPHYYQTRVHNIVGRALYE